MQVLHSFTEWPGLAQAKKIPCIEGSVARALEYGNRHLRAVLDNHSCCTSKLCKEPILRNRLQLGQFSGVPKRRSKAAHWGLEWGHQATCIGKAEGQCTAGCCKPGPSFHRNINRYITVLRQLTIKL